MQLKELVGAHCSESIPNDAAFTPTPAVEVDPISHSCMVKKSHHNSETQRGLSAQTLAL